MFEGAKGDGHTDDRAVIQRCINQACASGGGEVYFPKGIYKISEPLVFGGNQRGYATGYATGDRPYHAGRVILSGDGCGDRINASVGFTQFIESNGNVASKLMGSIIFYSSSGGYALDFPKNDVGGTCKNMYVHDMTFYSVSRDGVIRMTDLNTNTTFDRICISSQPEIRNNNAAQNSTLAVIKMVGAFSLSLSDSFIIGYPDNKVLERTSTVPLGLPTGGTSTWTVSGTGDLPTNFYPGLILTVTCTTGTSDTFSVENVINSCTINTASGTRTFSVADTWPTFPVQPVGGFQRFNIRLGESIGTGIEMVSQDGAGGGNQSFHNLTCSGFRTGFSFGSTFAPDKDNFYRNIMITNCQAQACRTGMLLRHGVSTLVCTNLWSELNTLNDIVIQQGAGLDSAISGDPVNGFFDGNIIFIGGYITSGVNTKVVIGDSTRPVGPVRFIGTTFKNFSGTAVRKTNSTGSKSLIFDGCSFDGTVPTSPSLVAMPNNPQYGDVIFQTKLDTNVPPSRFIVATSNTGTNINGLAKFYIPGMANPTSVTTFTHTGPNIPFDPVTGSNVMYLNSTGAISLLGDARTSVQVTLIFDQSRLVYHDAAVVTGFCPILLAGSADFTFTAGSLLQLVFIPVKNKWYEMGRTIM